MTLFEYTDETIYFHHSLDVTPDPADFPIHMHDRYELYCFVSGNARYQVEGRTCPLEYGSVLVMRAGESHRLLVDPSAAYERYAVHFSAQALPEGLRGLLAPFDDRPLGEGNCYSGGGFEGISPPDLLASACRGGDPRLRITALLPAVLLAVYRRYAGGNSASETRSTEAEMVDWVNARLCDPLSVGQVAERFHLSVSQTERVFRRATGTSVGRYCRAKQLLRARQMIAGGKPVQEACLACGFGDYSSFYRLYKKHFGHAPSEKK